MKIIHISSIYCHPAFSGAELHIKELSEGLVSRGHEVTVLTANVHSPNDLSSGISGKLSDIDVINGVKVVRFPLDGGLLGSVLKSCLHIRGGCRSLNLIFGKDAIELLTTRPLLVDLISYLARAQGDIVAVIGWDRSPAYYTYLARKLKRFTFVGIPLFHIADTWSQSTIYKRMLAACDAVLANTLHEADFIKERTKTRVEVGGVGVHPRLFECRNGGEIRARHRLGGLPVVGFVGRQTAGKGVLKLLDAMRIVWKWNDEVRLVLAGPRPSQHYHKAKAVIEGFTQFERERIVRIYDFPESDKASIFDAFDVFVLPSIEESFGIAYLEAWICRKPVIGARIGSTQCVINEGVDGLLVDPNDPQDIARAIIELLSDSNKRERMGRSGYAKTIAHFTWDKVTDKVEELYLELLAAKEAGRH